MTVRTVICRHCHANIPDGHLFCGRCGTPLPERPDASTETQYYSALQAQGQTQLTMLRGCHPEGSSFKLPSGSHVVGRQAQSLRLDDLYVSPEHAEFDVVEGRLIVSDLDSLNGVYLRIRQPTILEHGDMLRAGDHFFRFELLHEVSHQVDGVAFLCSPRREKRFRLVEIGAGGIPCRAYASPNNEVAVGRTGCDLSFPLDIFMSPRHFSVSASKLEPTVQDLGSHNGTFIRLRAPTELRHGDLIFMGEQLLRVELS